MGTAGSLPIRRPLLLSRRFQGVPDPLKKFNTGAGERSGAGSTAPLPMAPIKREQGPVNFAETFAFKDADRILYGWQKWISRSHPRTADDIDDRHLRKTVERLAKQSRDSAARHSAKSTLLPWKDLNEIWQRDRDNVERQRQPAPLHDISHKPPANGARQPRATMLRELTQRFRHGVQGGVPDGDEATWLTARMAARLHVIATELAEMLEKGQTHSLMSRLPHFTHTFLDDSLHRGWRRDFAKC